MQERELTQLNYLADAIVTAPGMLREFTGNVERLEPPQELMLAIDAIRHEFEVDQSANQGRPYTLERIRSIAARLSDSPNESVRAAGNALMRAIEHSSPRPRPMRRPALA